MRSTTSTGSSADDWAQIVRIDQPAGMTDMSLAVVDGNPAVSYFHYSEKSLRYARATTTTGSNADDWTPMTLIDYEGAVGARSSLAVINGLPMITCYANDPAFDLVYISANNSTGGTADSWDAPVVVDGEGDTGIPSSLAEVNSQPAIAFRDITNDRLRYAYYSP